MSRDAIVQRLEQIGVGNAVTIRRKDSQVFAGTLSKIGDNSAVVADNNLNAKAEVLYSDVQEITAGAVNAKPWNGRAKVSHTKRNLAIVFIAAGVLVPIIISASRRHAGPIFTTTP